MGACNVTLERHLEQQRLREEYLRQQPARFRSRPALLIAADGHRVALVASVRQAARPDAAV